jgi:hypothetical protein
MNRLTKNLSLVLAVQLLLVAAAFWPASNQAEGEANSSLLQLQEEVDRIVIGDGTTSVVLAGAGENWTLPDYHGLPVDQQKLNRSLHDLPALPRGWPLANSTGAANRFEVADDNFQRRVDYWGNNESRGGLLLGTSPGFRKVHTRIADTEAVYAVEFNIFDLPATPGEWLDKTLLQLPDVQSVQGLDYRIVKTSGGWRGKSADAPAQAEVDKLVNGLTSLRVTAAADIATAAIFEGMQVPPTLSVESSTGTFEFRLFSVEDVYYVQRSDIAVYFNLSALDHDRLNDVNAASLYPAGESSGPEDGAEEQDAPEN